MELGISELLFAGSHIALEVDLVEGSLQEVRQCHIPEWFLTVGTGALCIHLLPRLHAVMAEKARAICACLGLCDNFSAHHANEIIINFSDCLVFFQLGEASIGW